MNPNLNRLRRSMMFLNCQKPGLIKDPYIYKPDSIMLDLEDAVAENQKDAARYSLYHALQEIDYRGVERVVRINGLDTPHWKEDVRVCVAAVSYTHLYGRTVFQAINRRSGIGANFRRVYSAFNQRPRGRRIL